MEIERGFIKTSAGYIHYRATGQGRPVMLLHSRPQTSAMYIKLMEVLEGKLRLYAIDYPSSGCSDHVSGQPSISDYAKWVTEVMDGLGVKKANFLGEAIGGKVSVELANVYPERVENLILVNYSFFANKELNRRRHDLVKGEQSPTDASGFPLTRTLEFVLENDPDHIPLHPTQEWMDITNLAAVQAGRRRFQGVHASDAHDFASNLERLQHPVLLIWGDHFFYLQFRDEVTRRIKNHQVLIIKDGRFCLPWEHPEKVGQATLNFLK